MAFDIMLQSFTSDKIALDKNIATIATLSGTLREKCSIVDPVILIQADLSDVTAANYLYIPSFSRYYFINNIISITSTLVELHCHVDVLTSFKAFIRTNQAIINRSEKDWNLYLNDGSIKVYANSIVLTKAFPTGFTKQSYVMAVASPDVASPEPESESESN